MLLQFYEELVYGIDAEEKSAEQSSQPANKKIKFTYSESSSEDDDDDRVNSEEDVGDEGDGEEEKEVETASNACLEKDGDTESLKNEMIDPQKNDEARSWEHAAGAATDVDKNENGSEDLARDAVEAPVKKQCLGTDSSRAEIVDRNEKSVDKLIEAELEELSDKNKVSLKVDVSVKESNF